MRHSESIAAIAAALAKAQRDIKGAAKDAANPFFKTKYADLASVWDACRDALSINGISVVQGPEAEGPVVRVTTLLAHSSGEWMESVLSLTATQDTPQGIGSAVTYGRRYGLASMVGVAPEDDDGNAASLSATTQARPPPKKPKAEEPPPMPEPKETPAQQLWGRAKTKWGKDAMGHYATAVKAAGIPKETPSESWTPAQVAEVERFLFPKPEPIVDPTTGEKF